MLRRPFHSSLSWSLTLSLLLGLTGRAFGQEAAIGDHATLTSLPKVTLLRENDGQDGDKNRMKWPWEFVFEDSARFAWVGFDIHGCTVEQDALVIYDGMTVRVERDGRFEMRCRIEAPKTPITVRMQLTVVGFLTESGQSGSITIPPFRVLPFEANDRSDLNETSDSYEVVYVGRSELLRRLNRDHLSKNENNAKSAAKFGMDLADEDFKQAYLVLKEARATNGNAIHRRDMAKQAIDAELKSETGDQEDVAVLPKPALPAAESKKTGEAGELKEGKATPLTKEQKAQARKHLQACEFEVMETGKLVKEKADIYEAAHRERLAAQQHFNSIPDSTTPRSLKDEAKITFARTGTSRFGSVPRK